MMTFSQKLISRYLATQNFAIYTYSTDHSAWSRVGLSKVICAVLYKIKINLLIFKYTPVIPIICRPPVPSSTRSEHGKSFKNLEVDIQIFYLCFFEIMKTILSSTFQSKCFQPLSNKFTQHVYTTNTNTEWVATEIKSQEDPDNNNNVILLQPTEFCNNYISFKCSVLHFQIYS